MSETGSEFVDLASLLWKIDRDFHNKGGVSGNDCSDIITHISNLCIAGCLGGLAAALRLLSGKGYFDCIDDSDATITIAEMVSGIVGLDVIKEAAQGYRIDNGDYRRSESINNSDSVSGVVADLRRIYFDSDVFSVLMRAVYAKIDDEAATN